ncbi:hypothetical protein RY831_04500 [Noviherbaspirillum sp. CPCC 100848]|uniref:Uncharacterized protein n=1 Tax=Noviherbaspirillum album TaxID=3080276 RepID=A0ABU6J4E4_9BURK|nr:hypothetical protein [Noviherbaspirillum sp. CPCC 100848]MEC4718393.1 hypothetical protein [Noviherbaspirillum sp. CPCC 100848]
MTHSVNLFRSQSLAVLAAATCSVSAFANTPDKICAGQVCLGMDVSQVAKISLDESGTFPFSWHKGSGTIFGLDSKGQKLYYTGGDLTRKNANEVSERIKTVCTPDSVSGRVKASDGQLIRFTMRPVMADGNAKFFVAEISRTLPANMSESELKAFESQVRERYGDAYTTGSPTVVTKPTANIKNDFALGRMLQLRQPWETNRSKLLQQPGCSDVARID